MADGHFRFQQGAGQFFHSQANQPPAQPRQMLLRPGSPSTNNSRIGFSNDTPSPSRSPGRHSPSHSTYGMYGQGHQQGQNSLINGHQRYGMGMNMPKQYQGGNQHHPSHSGHHQSQEHASHNGHGANFNGHQHNTSTSGFGSGTPHFQPNHLRNGTPNSLQNGLSKPPNEQWAHQLQLAALARESSLPHPHARLNANTSKSLSTVSDTSRRELDRGERTRASASLDDARQHWAVLDCAGQGLRALAPQLFEYRFLDKLYLNNNKLTYLPESIGQLRGLSHLDLSINHIMELPAELGMLVNLKALLLFDNNLETLPNELGSLYQLEILGIDGNPLTELYRHIMVEQGTREMITYLRERAAEPEPPADREWIILDETETTRTAEKLLVLSYNTLCDKAATQAAYGYTPMNALSWDHRKNVILDEIRARNADVTCMQEVDMENFHDFFRPALAHNGYKGVYFPRPKARTMADRDAKQVDGCAIFFKDSRFILLDKQIIDFVNTAINRPDMKDQHDIFNRVMPKDNIGVAVFLENRASGERVIVVNSHLAWDPHFKDVKVVQTAILMEQVAKLAEGWTKTPPCKDKKLFRFTDMDTDGDSEPAEPTPEPLPSKSYAHADDIPLIMCTDLNSTSDSGVYELISQGTLAHDHPDLGDYKYGNFTRDGMAHPFKLRSSYAQIGELEFTNYTAGFSGVIDYIWYSTKAFQVTGLLGEVDPEYLQRVPGFPNYHFPSDHLALMAEFVLKPAAASTSAASVRR